MEDKFKPKINCRFKTRKDLDGFIGFFQGRGVLTLNEVGAFIVNQMTGNKSLLEIGLLVKNVFPAVKNPVGEVLSFAKQLKKTGFL